MSTRILLADDHEVLLEGLKASLEQQEGFEVVGMAHDGREAVEQAKRIRPDVILMDVTMPQVDGVTATAALRESLSTVKIIALSMHASRELAATMLAAGANGYVVKSCSVDRLTEAVNTVMGGQQYLCPEVAPTSEAPAVPPAVSPERLTPREREILCLVAEGDTSKEIAARLHLSTRTVEWHRKSIMDKLGIRSIAELTRYAIRHGLVPLAD